MYLVTEWSNHLMVGLKAYMVLLSQKLNTKKTVSETIRSSEGHLLTDPQLLILHVSHKLVDSLHLLQLFSPLDQRLLNLGESGDKNLRIKE